MPRPTTNKKKAKFLVGIERNMFVIDAAKYASVDRTTPYKWEIQDPEFAQHWADVRQMRLSQLTDTAVDRALHGSDDLLKFLITRFDRQAEGGKSTTIGEIAIIEYEERPDDDDGPPPEFFTFDKG
ncbi:MAG: hypothetical protein V3S68_04850 [Dehalococcoidia bacterium]